MAYYYLKLYHDILDDPKMGRLSDHLFRRVIELFLIASETKERNGYLPPIDDISWRLRTDTDQLQMDLENIEAQTGIIRHTIQGWLVINFVKRQDAVSGAERTQRYRERNVKELFVSQPSNEPVTNRHTELKLDIDIEVDKELNTEPEEQAKAAATAAAFHLYETNIGIITPLIADALTEAANKYPEEWLDYAFKEAVKKEARNWAYIRSILSRLEVDGFKPRQNGRQKQKDEPVDYTAGEYAGFIKH